MTMKKLQAAFRATLALALISSFGCAPTRHDSLSVSEPAAVAGEELAARLTTRYEDTRRDCGGSSRPAFLCSGLLIRGTDYSTAFDFWNPSPGSIERGGVSFSYLRADAIFVNGVTELLKGFIATPPLQSNAVTPFMYLCAFPIDAATNNRSDRGCGMYRQDPSSRYCSEQGITTTAQFLAKFREDATHGNPKFKQCSFDVRDSSNETSAAAFDANVQAIREVNHTFVRYDENELIVKTWPQHVPGELPIEALFYFVRGDNDPSLAISYAQHDQRRFKEATGRILPIVRLSLPTNFGGKAEFHYFPDDQAVIE